MKETENTPHLPKRDAATFLTLFRECFFISATTFGGGMVIMAILQKTFTEKHKWFTEDEILDMIAIAQSCPGVMAVNSSIIIGYRIGGVVGALLTLIGTIMPPMIILSIISVFYAQFRSNRAVELVFRGMQSGVVAVIASALITMVRNVIKNRNWLTIPLLIAACTSTVIVRMDVIWVILICGALGGVTTYLELKHLERKDPEQKSAAMKNGGQER